MVKRQETDKHISEIRKSIEADEAVIGTKKILESLRHGKVKEVFLTSNCPDYVSKEIEHIKKLSDFNIVRIKQSNEELGVICKKPFAISVLGLLK